MITTKYKKANDDGYVDGCLTLTWIESEREEQLRQQANLLFDDDEMTTKSMWDDVLS